MSTTAFGRLGRGDQGWWSPGSGEPETVFVDLGSAAGADSADVAAELRSLPSRFPMSASRLVVRLWDSFNEPAGERAGPALRANADRLRWTPTIHLINHNIGRRPTQRIVLPDGTLEEESEAPADLLWRCRAAEVSALLELNEAIWRPRAYHYQMPSGTHSNTFVRLADAIRNPYEAKSLATWLLHRIQPATGILVDSASLTPIALAVEQLSARAGVDRIRFTSLEDYPSSDLDTMKAVRDIDDGQSSIVALLSVHSTGTVRDRIVRALNAIAPTRWSLDVVVDKPGFMTSGSARFPEAGDNSLKRIDVWFGLGATSETSAFDCPDCRASDRARVVHIDPRTFAGMVLPEPDFATPSVIWAARQRDFWELVDRRDALFLDADSDVRAGHPRHGEDKRITVKVDFDQLLANEGWAELADLSSLRVEELIRTGEVDEAYDLVVLDARDVDRSGFLQYSFDALRQIADQWIAIDDPEPERWTQVSIDAIRSAERILLFRMGLVTGLSMQRLLLAIQDVRRDTAAEYRLHALVAHIRTATVRERETLSNSIARGRLRFLWESYLPWRQSPLQDEKRTLLRAPNNLAGAAEDFLEERKKVCANFGAEDQVLWGVGPHSGDDAARVSPMSYFGERLRARAVFAAVGAAVQHARLRRETAMGAPLWRVFEMPAIVRSYYDPIILACVLRWLEPREIWWGATPREAEDSIQILVERCDEQAMRCLLPELLLATAQAKLPQSTAELLVAKSRIVLDSFANTEDHGPLELGIALVTHAA